MPIVIGIDGDENEIIEHVEDFEYFEEEDVEPEENMDELNNGHAVDLAILCNYEANMNINDFNTIEIPALNINYNDFVSLAFNNPELFDIYMMDRLFKHLKLSLVNTFLTEYEKKQNTTRNIMDPSVKIKLIKEFSFTNLSNIIKKYETLNLKEFNVSIGSTSSKKGSITAKINIRLYSNIVNIGIIIPFLFKIQDIPDKLTNDNEDITYDFSNREEPKIVYYVELTDCLNHHHSFEHHYHHACLDYHDDHNYNNHHC
jgi:hypothetical protein